MQHFVFTAPLPISSKSNYRLGKQNWGKHTSFENIISMLTRQHIPENWPISTPETPLTERPRIILSIAAKSTIDSTNYTKSVADALEGIVTLNDASITTATTLAERGKGNHLTIGIAVTPPDTTLEEQAHIAAELNQKVLEEYRNPTTT